MLLVEAIELLALAWATIVEEHFENDFFVLKGEERQLYLSMLLLGFLQSYFLGFGLLESS
jgi:hypothetical protein